MLNLAQVLEHPSDEVNALKNPVALDKQIVVNGQFLAVLMSFGISAYPKFRLFTLATSRDKVVGKDEHGQREYPSYITPSNISTSTKCSNS